MGLFSTPLTPVFSDAASHTGEFEDKLTECARLVGGNAPESFE
jgi:hypothetical protein